MKILNLLILCLVLFTQAPVFSQIGVDNTSPDPSSVLDLTSTDKGLLIPRMTSAQRTAIASPASSLLVFDTTLNLYFYYFGGQWRPLNPWLPSSSNIYYNSGNVGIGTISPRGKFDIDGPGDIYLSDDLIVGTNQSLFMPGHIFISPYNGSDVSYLQARRVDDSGTTSLRFRTSNTGVVTEAMHIAGNGNVGVGTISPGYKLDVSGPVNASAYYVNGSPLSFSGTVPTGGIIMWSGAIGSIPSGWALCDGSNGTPDLRNRFIVGAGSTYGVGNTGGNVSIALLSNQIPHHTHAGTTTSDGSHTHTINGETMQKEGTSTQQVKVLDTGTDANLGNYTELTASGGAHSHSISSITSTNGITGAGQQVDIRPPYYALAYIMKLP